MINLENQAAYEEIMRANPKKYAIDVSYNGREITVKSQEPFLYLAEKMGEKSARFEWAWSGKAKATTGKSLRLMEFLTGLKKQNPYRKIHYERGMAA